RPSRVEDAGKRANGRRPFPASGERSRARRASRDSIRSPCRNSTTGKMSRAAACLHRGRTSFFSAPVCFLIAFILLGSASAQTTYVPDDWKFGKRLEANTLHYCVDARDPDFPVARKIGEAIAAALLLQPKEHVIGENLVGEELDNLYRVFLETC